MLQAVVTQKEKDKESYGLIICGCKIDDHANARQVTSEEGLELAMKWKTGFIETSAKKGIRTAQLLVDATLAYHWARFQKHNKIGNEVAVAREAVIAQVKEKDACTVS